MVLVFPVPSLIGLDHHVTAWSVVSMAPSFLTIGVCSWTYQHLNCHDSVHISPQRMRLARTGDREACSYRTIGNAQRIDAPWLQTPPHAPNEIRDAKDGSHGQMLPGQLDLNAIHWARVASEPILDIQPVAR